MKRIFYLFFILVLSSAGSIYSQKAINKGFIGGDGSGKEIIDLSETAFEKCSQTLRKEVGENFVEVKFQPLFAAEAEMLAEELKLSLTETKKIVLPLKIDSVRFYLLQMDNPPPRYSIYEKNQPESVYIHLAVFKNPKDFTANSQFGKSYRREIFHTIPHELTHLAIGDLITSEKTRWFDDGLAEYVGNTVAGKVFSAKSENIITYDSLISLHRIEIRYNLWLWKEPTLKSISGESQKQLLNEFYFYGASYQLIKEIVAEAENKGIENPLFILLTQLKESKEKTGKSAGTPEIISLIERYLKVNPKTLGVLDEQTQKKLVGEALDLLSQNEISPEKKYSALYTLAGIGETNLSDKWINYLLDEVYNSTSEEFQKDLAATALAQRFNQNNFDKVLTAYLDENKSLKGKSAKKIKLELQELSIRPKPQ